MPSATSSRQRDRRRRLGTSRPITPTEARKTSVGPGASFIIAPYAYVGVAEGEGVPGVFVGPPGVRVGVGVPLPPPCVGVRLLTPPSQAFTTFETAAEVTPVRKLIAALSIRTWSPSQNWRFWGTTESASEESAVPSSSSSSTKRSVAVIGPPFSMPTDSLNSQSPSTIVQIDSTQKSRLPPLGASHVLWAWAKEGN